MGLRTLTPLIVLALALALTRAPLVSGAASYSLSISPSVPVSLGSSMTFTLTLSGGNRNSAFDPGTNIFEVIPKRVRRKDEVTLVASTGFWHYGDVMMKFDSSADADKIEQQLDGDGC